MLRMLGRGTAGRVLLALLAVVLLWTCQLAAQDPTCGNYALEQIVKWGVDDREMAIAFNRLHGLTLNARKGADDLLRVSDDAQSAAIVDQLIAKLGTAQVEDIFIRVERFSKEAKEGVAFAARLAPYEGVDVGVSVAKYMQRNEINLPLAAKEQFFKDLRDLNGIDGADRVLKRAAGQSDLGETLVAGVSAKLRRDGDRGTLVSADADFGGTGDFEGWKIDVQTSVFGVQVKSRFRNQDLTSLEIKKPELQKLVDDCKLAGVKPALASNGNITGELVDWCVELKIDMWPNYVTIPQ